MKCETVNLWNDGTQARYVSYILDSSEELKLMSRRPAVIICPGGGYVFTSHREGEPVAMHFLNRGFQVFVLHYHTKQTGGSAFPQPLFDIAKLILEIRTRANEWNIDPQKVSVVGFSAGANLCSLLSTRWHSPLLSEKFNADSALFRPDTAVLCYPLTAFDMDANKALKTEIPDKLKPYAHLLKEIYANLCLALFNTETPSTEQRDSINSIKDIDERTPPTFIWGLAKDFIAPVENCIGYANRLSSYNVPFELHIFGQGGHGLSKATPDSAATPEDINNEVAKWQELLDNWLKKYIN